MVPTQHPAQAPDIPELLALLHAHQIRFVLTGSVAAQLYGVRLQPGDLDITPALDRENLSRLAAMLAEIEATIDGALGHWEPQPDGEQKWIEVEQTTEERAIRAAVWKPDPDDSTTFDHLFHTRYGNFDVVPQLSGSYDILIQRAVQMQAYGETIWVAHIDELLATVTIPRRKKDIPRVEELRAIQRHRGTQRQEP
jgi:hypothetical protein